MKVAVTFSGCHRRGGVERVVFECVRFLAGRGHEVDVYANEWEAEESSRVHYRSVPMWKKPGFMGPVTFYRACTKALNPKDYDVVSTHGCVSPTAGVQWVHSVHRAWLDHSRGVRKPLSAARIKQRLNPLHPMLLKLESHHFTGRQYRKVIALTRDVKADLIRYYGVPDQDILIVPNGFSPTEFNPTCAMEQREQMRRQLGYGPDDKVIVFVANELERKGFGPLLRATVNLADPTVRLLIVGRVSDSSYATEIENLGMKSRVLFTGPSADVTRYYAAADAFALPTQYEAWGLVIVEAMACGLPVLTSRLAGASIAVKEGSTGLLLDRPTDVAEITARLSSLLNLRTTRETIAASVAEYAWPRVLEQYERVLMDHCN